MNISKEGAFDAISIGLKADWTNVHGTLTSKNPLFTKRVHLNISAYEQNRD